MTLEELQVLEEEKSSYKGELSRLNLEMKDLKEKLEVLQNEWEGVYEKFTIADRKIAMATKLHKVGKVKVDKPKQELSPEMAKEILKMLGAEL